MPIKKNYSKTAEVRYKVKKISGLIVFLIFQKVIFFINNKYKF